MNPTSDPLSLLRYVLPANVLAALPVVVPYIVAAFFYGFLFSLLWGALKALWPRVLGKPFPRTRFTMAVDSLVELLPNALGTVNKWLAIAGLPPLYVPFFYPQPGAVSRPTTAPPPPPPQDPPPAPTP